MEENGQKEEKPLEGYLIPASIIAAGVIVALAIFVSGGFFHKPENTPASGGAPTTAGAPADLAGSAPFLGNPNAPVTFVEFSDFQCPFCNRFFREAGKQIIDTYVKSGQVKFVYRNFAFLGQESNWAAEAAACANDQGKFWTYHDYLFNYIWDNYYGQNKSGENVGAFSKDHLKQFAAAVGLDTAAFTSCLDSGKYTAAVLQDTADGRAAGVTGTPTSFINGKSLTGALPFSQFQSLIDAALSGK